MNNLELMRQRLISQGGNQEGRMIKDKYKSFDKALMYSYQGTDIQKEGGDIVRALINPDKVKSDYDDKILSIDNAHGYKCGDVFRWILTDTHWIIYLEQITEDAYFRAEIRRCKYKLRWVNTETKEIEWTWAYTRGPVETKINAIQKSGISVDVPNYSLDIYIPNNEQNFNKFQRYEKFLFDDMAWEVSVVDRISMDGVIQIIAVENYINTVTDNREKNLVDGFVVLPIRDTPDPDNPITGPDYITPTLAAQYSCSSSISCSWTIKEPKRPLKVKVIDASTIELLWTDMSSGNFTLVCATEDGTYEKGILVESLM